MEDGIAGAGGGAVIASVTVEDNVYTLDKKWSELKALLDNGAVVFARMTMPTGTQVQMLTLCAEQSGQYFAVFISGTPSAPSASQMTFICDSEEGYPSYDDN